LQHTSPATREDAALRIG